MPIVMPIQEGASIERKLAAVTESITNVHGSVYTCCFNDDYTRTLEAACKLEDKSGRELAVDLATKLRHERKRLFDAQQALEEIRLQLVAMQYKDESQKEKP